MGQPTIKINGNLRVTNTPPLGMNPRLSLQMRFCDLGMTIHALCDTCSEEVVMMWEHLTSHKGYNVEVKGNVIFEQWQQYQKQAYKRL